ncbi:RNA polymerase sigma factor, sigma-70 family [Pedobacter steynii]|uniref:RNA polymerase sigma factor, sigma-70 family n=1 Tax=Pedobacter steynii TaxID=430522 RepID=A0A1G9NLG0_9SPHI|nr:sigma-70 family RNA polymerase sigma factor [Pedobacter steynii]NQX39275.1 sigma-70 family RNA polymerase sigma factor [Pedobacter steynii]SDL86815.1 RNA polymerase sigma factor, sigma-70 family [Pedobacter steynii]
MSINENNLWLSYKNGNVDALFTIHELLYADLFEYGRNITLDQELIKDTINQFFLYLWDKRESVNEPNNLKSYIIVSFRRRLLMEIKESKKTDSLVDGALSLFVAPSPEDFLIADQSDLEMRLKVRKALDKLPKRQRELIILKYYEELSYEEIGLKTSLSIRTIYNKLYEAIKFLKKEVLFILL